MAKNKGAKNRSIVSSQKYLGIAEIREDAVIMRDNTLRAVLLVSSVNFALKSEDEQGAIISSYVSFLNNIDFPLQIVIQSRELDINGYLEQLKQKEKEQTNELLKIQTAEYAQYIEELVSMAKIMNKRFYVVIPYNPMSDKKKNFFSSLWEVLKPATLIKMREDNFLRYKTELGRRVDNVVNNLSSAGLNAVQLDTQSLIELYYSTYNPKTAKNQRMADVKDLRVAE